MENIYIKSKDLDDEVKESFVLTGKPLRDLISLSEILDVMYCMKYEYEKLKEDMEDLKEYYESR